MHLSVVILIVKFSHKVHLTCLDDFASEVLLVPPQKDYNFEGIPEQQMFLIVKVF